jgi:ferredoxin
MCPSYRVTRDERDVTRGRANTLRLAISGPARPDALASDEMAETMKLCVSCKGCRRECPTGVDMARMKIEVLAARARASEGVTLRDRLVAYLPRYAPYAARVPWLMNLRDRCPARRRRLSERLLGLAADRRLPRWRGDFPDAPGRRSRRAAKEVVLFADTFNRYFEPRTGDRPRRAGGRPGAQLPAGFRDEMPALLGAEWTAEQAGQVMLFEEFIAARGRRRPASTCRWHRCRSRGAAARPLPPEGFGAVAPVQEVLG